MDTTVFINAEEPEVRHYRQHSSFSVVQIAKGVKVLFHGDDHENNAEEFAARLEASTGPEEIEDVDLLVDTRLPSAAA